MFSVLTLDPEMNIDIQANDGILICKINGNLEADSISQLGEAQSQLGEAKEKLVALDLGGVGFIDSTGIGALVSLHKQLKPLEKLVCFVGAVGQPSDMLGFLKIDKVIPCYGDLAELRSAQT